MKKNKTRIEGVYVVEIMQHMDERGAFARWFCNHELNEVTAGNEIVQINYSRTEKPGAIRGLHFQYPPFAEIKMVRCIKGKVWDVALDLRKDSPTFLKWHAEELCPENGRMVIVPEGCAHGFQVLSQSSELLYLHTAAYKPEAEGGILFEDPMTNIDWPLPASEVSERDRKHPLLSESYEGISL